MFYIIIINFCTYILAINNILTTIIMEKNKYESPHQ